MDRTTRKVGNYCVTAEPKLAFVIRIPRRQSQGANSAAASSSLPDLQWCVCQADQDLHQHDQDCRTLHCMGLQDQMNRLTRRMN
ncbi:hypothetical protein AAFF_G00094180 [Aldrovandia affinis]|uniref:Uncharacterized protein n=1 Tax=Aldrovandia affinis TaxID=143900 RepID=A0AAD7T432_9TELE|nr:hypothetical protein AAFF_G00094180 [Aldrovandia affinis]